MAKVKLNPFIVEFSGTIGDIVFKKSKSGEVFISRRPRKSNDKPSEAQKAQRERFKLSIAYAKAAMEDPTIRALYEKMAAKKRMSAFAVAQSDYFKGKDLLSRE